MTSSQFQSSPNQISVVILDLDGTLLDTENATKGVMKEFLAAYGKELDKEREEKQRLGMTLRGSAVAIIKDYDLPLTPDQFIDRIMPLYRAKWSQARALPGANRVIKHLRKHGVPFALASNSLSEYIYQKLSHQEGWKEYFSVILGSDQVKAGKPAPDIFIEAARRMGVDAERCLVIEDSLVGVKAAKAAQMKVVAVPSQSEADASSIADSVLHSLLEFHPELWGLPPFDDWINNTLLIEPIYMSCSYKNGFSYEVSEHGKLALPHQVTGLYFGWAQVGISTNLKVLVGIGSKQCSYSGERTMRIHVIDGALDEKTDQQVKLVLVGYISGSNSMSSIPELLKDGLVPKGNIWMEIEVTEDDKSRASASLDLPIFLQHYPRNKHNNNSACIKNSIPSNCNEEE